MWYTDSSLLRELCIYLKSAFIYFFIPLFYISYYFLIKTVWNLVQKLFVILGFTRDSCSFRACTQSCLQYVLICDLHEKIELSPPPSIPPAEEETRKRVVAVNTWIRCHTLPLCGKILVIWRSPQNGGGKRGQNIRILKRLKHPRLIFPKRRTKKVECPQIGSRQNGRYWCFLLLVLLLAGYRRQLIDKLRTKYRVTLPHT